MTNVNGLKLILYWIFFSLFNNLMTRTAFATC